MECQTEGTIWKSVKSWIRNMRQKWPCIVVAVTYRENKQWVILIQSFNTHTFYPLPKTLPATSLLSSIRTVVVQFGIYGTEWPSCFKPGRPLSLFKTGDCCLVYSHPGAFSKTGFRNASNAMVYSETFQAQFCSLWLFVQKDRMLFEIQKTLECVWDLICFLLRHWHETFRSG